MHIGLDGMNLALRRGTGVSTYSRVLSVALRQLGSTIDVLYGLRIPPHLNSLLKEVSFFDILGSDLQKVPLVKGFIQEEAGLLRSPFGLKAFYIPVTGAVVSDSFLTRMPSYDHLFNIYDLFSAARRHYRRYGRFLEVSIPDPPKIMHWTYPMPIRLKHAKNIYTIHDLVPLRLPYTTLDNKRYYYRLIRDCIITGDLICTVSERSKEDIEEIFRDYKPEKLFNTYEAVTISPEFLAKSNDQIKSELCSVFNLTFGDYFLFFGAIEPKKNVARLIEAFLYADTTSGLVIVGNKAWKYEQELELLGSADKKNDWTSVKIKRLEYVPFPLLISLIRGAKAVVWPSLYEGFGLPVLEAMLLGTPVLTSTGGSLPEVAGDAALMVDPYNTSQIAAGLKALDADSELRADLVQRGYAQAARFTMERYKERLSLMYTSLLSS